MLCSAGGSYVSALGAVVARGAAVALVPAVALVTAVALGLGRAMEAEGPSLMLLRRSPLGKMGLPGSGFGAGASGATGRLGALRLACRLRPELTPGIPGAFALMPAAEA